MLELEAIKRDKSGIVFQVMAIVAVKAVGRNVFVRAASRNMGRLLGLALLLLVCGCASNSPNGVSLKGLAKSDIDLVADAHRRMATDMTAQLLVKLYKRNPRELRRESGISLSLRERQFATQEYDAVSLRAVSGSRGIEAIRLAFDSDYSGDRVFALMLGISDMLHESYGGKHEFYMFDELDQQKLYHSARNLEVVAWLLRSRIDARGQPLILSNHLEGRQANLSFERLLGKMIANQDMMAVIIAGKSQRAINTVAHSVVSMTLIPL